MIITIKDHYTYEVDTVTKTARVQKVLRTNTGNTVYWQRITSAPKLARLLRWAAACHGTGSQ